MTQDKLFPDFSPTSKEEWMAKVEKDLKGKPLEELFWQLEEDITLPPFYHKEDLDGPLPPMQDSRDDSDWEIGEYINVRDYSQANKSLLEGLEKGVQAPLLRLYKPIDEQGLDQLLKGVEPAYISLHFGEYYTDKQPQQIFEFLKGVLKSKGSKLAECRGSLDFDPLLDFSEPPIQSLATMIRFCQQEMPKFRPLQINANRFHGGSEYTSVELAYTIAKGNEYLARLSDEGVSADVANQHLQFGISISKSYFVEIAKLRALKLLWANVLKAHGCEHQQVPYIVAHFSKESQDEEMYDNMIRASTQAMSAVIGGAHRLYVLPSNHALQKPSTSFTRRVARNVQHLLKMESHLHKVVDPGAGSYYVEKLTQLLSEKAWKKFQQLEEEGAFRQA
jgi:methylmalonyl-CoA mutase